MKETSEGLKREIGVWGQSSNILNSVIGAGIFVLPAIVAGSLGSGSIIAYLFCGILITAIMLCFGEVGGKVTHTGGAYKYIESSFGRYSGFITSNLFIFGATVMACAAISNALADTLAYLLPAFENRIVRSVFFIFLFSGFAAVHRKFATPYISIILFNSLGCFFALVGEFKQLAVLSSASILLIYLGVALALINSRIKREAKTGSFRTPGGYLVPVISVVIIIWFLSNLTGKEIIGMISFIAILSLIYSGIRIMDTIRK